MLAALIKFRKLEVTRSLWLSCEAIPWGCDVGEPFAPCSGLWAGTQGSAHPLCPLCVPPMAAWGTVASEVSGRQALPRNHGSHMQGLCWGPPVPTEREAGI